MPDVDFELWKQWDEKGRRKSDLIPLMQRFEPLVEKQVSIFRRVNIPEAAIRTKAQTFLVDAFDKFDPKRKVKLNTFVNGQIQQLKRFITSHQNFARIPEPMIYRIGEYNLAERELTNEMDRDPSVIEMANKLKWPAKHVETMRKVLRKDLSATMFDIDPNLIRESRWTEVKALIPYELNPQENKVYETVFKAKAPLTTAEIAKKLKMTTSQVNTAKKNIGLKINQYMV